MKIILSEERKETKRSVKKSQKRTGMAGGWGVPLTKVETDRIQQYEVSVNPDHQLKSSLNIIYWFKNE